MIAQPLEQILENEKYTLNTFFSKSDNINLLNYNFFDELYSNYFSQPEIREVPKRVYGLTALFLKSNIPFLNYMKHVQSYCFFGIDIKSIEIPEGIIELNYSCFQDCTTLRYIFLPKTLNFIYSDVFSGCINLYSIDYRGTKEDWENIIKSSYWSNNSSIKTIHCTDGDIEL